ncbi:MAG: sensor histidine kinase [Eubacteriales bacterium]|nr:sensor histidine kinase [Eubacteriales bacterium]
MRSSLKKRRGNSLQMVTTSFFMGGMVLLLLFVSVSLVTRLNTLLENNATERTRQTVDQGNASLGVYVNEMLDTMEFFGNLVSSADEVASEGLSDSMAFLQSSRKDVAAMAVFSPKGVLLASTAGDLSKAPREVATYSWFIRPLNAATATVYFSSPYVQNIFAGQYAWVITLSRRVEYHRDGQKETGVLMADFIFSGITSLCENISLGTSGYVYLVDTETQLVYHPQQQLIYAGLKQENLSAVQAQVFGRCRDHFGGRDRLLIITTVDYTRWRMVGVAYLDEILSAQPELIRISLSVLLAGILLSMAVATISGAYVSKPIRQLEQVMAKVEAGNLDISIEEQGFAEIRSLSRTFNHMLGRIRRLMEQIVHEQELKRLHELNALQAQINPHFLYNTLDSIVWMEERGRSKEAIAMVTALARLFRISISKGRNMIAVREELEHVRNYLIIQKMRFTNKFDFTIEAEPETLELRTIKLIVQPIVENAIQHGLEEYAVEEGLVEIKAYLENGDLVYRVRDNGVGMPQSQVETILTSPAGKSGIGVKNVHERIQLTFGKPYGLTIHSVLDEGTEVLIRLPVLREANE